MWKRHSQFHFFFHQKNAPNWYLDIYYARQTPGSICQCKEYGLVWRPWVRTSHTVYSCELIYVWYVIPKVVFKCMTTKFGSFFKHLETGKKDNECDQFFCPRSDFSNFCYPYFFYHILTDGVSLVDRAFAEIWDQFVMLIELHWKINI